MTQCRGCGANILWAHITREDGSEGRVPLDPSAAVYRIRRDAFGGISAERDRECLVSHFKTCPRASDFSRPRRKANQGGRRS